MIKVINCIIIFSIAIFSTITLAVENDKFNKKNISDNMNVKILFLAGSARKGSINKKLVNNAYEIAQKLGVNATLIDLKDYSMPIYDGDLEDASGMPTKAKELKKLFMDNDGIFIASPEYNSSITPLLKNALDWISRTNEKNEPFLLAYKNKIFGLSGASPSDFGAKRSIEALKLMLENMGLTVASKTFALTNAYEKFSQEGQLNDNDVKELKEVVINFIDLTKEAKNTK